MRKEGDRMRSTGLKIIRQEMGVTQERMMELLELKSPSHYTMIENGQRGISLNLFNKIVEVSQKPMKEVFYILKSHEVTNLSQIPKNNTLTERQVSTGKGRETHGFQSASSQ